MLVFKKHYTKNKGRYNMKKELRYWGTGLVVKGKNGRCKSWEELGAELGKTGRKQIEYLKRKYSGQITMIEITTTNSLGENRTDRFMVAEQSLAHNKTRSSYQMIGFDGKDSSEHITSNRRYSERESSLAVKVFYELKNMAEMENEYEMLTYDDGDYQIISNETGQVLTCKSEINSITNRIDDKIKVLSEIIRIIRKRMSIRTTDGPIRYIDKCALFSYYEPTMIEMVSRDSDFITEQDVLEYCAITLKDTPSEIGMKKICKLMDIVRFKDFIELF